MLQANCGRNSIYGRTLRCRLDPFKEVEGGYLFKLNPWLFGSAHVYLVDEAKRAEIISQMERNRHAIDRAKQRAKVFLMFGAMGSLFFKSWHGASGWPLDRLTTFTVLV